MPQFEQYLRAGFPVVWVNTVEPQRCERELAAAAHQVHETPAYRWDVVIGFRPLEAQEGQACGPVKAVQQASGLDRTVTFLHNLHRFLGSVEVIQAIQNAIPSLKARGSCLVILAPGSDKLPEELARHVVVWEFPLPSREELGKTADKIATDAELHPDIPFPNTLLDAALGLTEGEAEDAFALSVVEKRALDPQVVAREKAGALLRQAKITYEQFPDRFSDLGGLENLKRFTLATATSPLALGIFLLGVPGAGKSTFARCLGNELGIPTLALDFGKMMGSLVGQSEGNIRAALQAVDAMGRVVLFIDEISEGLAGAGSSGQLDSGTKSGVTSTFLKWLSDRKPGQVYIVATANRIDTIPPQYLRAERWDSLWWIDMPTREEKDIIWPIWENKFRIDYKTSAKALPDDKDWTGAEIRTCCRVAAMMGCSLVDAAAYVVPVAKSMAEAIQEMRSWAKGRALLASDTALPQSGRRLIHVG